MELFIFRVQKYLNFLCSVSDLLDFISPEQESKGNDYQRKQRRAKIFPVNDKNNQERDDAVADEVIIFNGSEDATTNKPEAITMQINQLR